ncbi:aspartic-type endopeptidase [Penicillium alfredii]|uniref:Aspartic-type endopeptidase n=1 Tax=Penicillium alfredii TaxID=1506179 RepID=A0A9W9F938_9EURO|nr:aspartic-type endopeptidase [Penicillium alfredii]KAJ5095913.1 aspartic-type endopeptidase [Penicillium alfredii]
MRQLLLFVFSAVLQVTDAAASPYVMKWSDQAYGPDGPWQGVAVEIGSNKQPVALYPGANYASTILLDSICSNKTTSSTCYASQAGTYNQTESKSAVVLNRTSWETVYWSVEGKGIEGRIGDQVSFGPSVPNVSFQAVYDTYETYPNGKVYPVQVGSLALGAPWTADEVDNKTTFNWIASWLYRSGGDNAIPSYSYSMHIGSAGTKVPGSLVLGGYDKSRVLGNVSAQSVSLNSDTSGQLQIRMKDMGLGIAGGSTPPGFTSQDGIFQQSNGATLPKTVVIDPTKPYLYLPEATCDAIANSLPVSFNDGLGLYFWDTTHSNYATLMSSAPYLSFTFEQDGVSNQNITIKVPLAQLALTLQAPLVETNTTYFPCFYSTDTPVLGRAFLQSAFVGVNWHEGKNTGTWFLGQAPGPALSKAEITPIHVSSETLSGSSGSWEQTWAQYWHLDTSSSGDKSNTNAGLSTGAKAGVGVGVSVAGLIIIAAAVWLWMRRAKRHPKPAPGTGPAELPTLAREGLPQEIGARDVYKPQGLLGSDKAARELETKHHPAHEPAEQVEPPRYELG